MIESDVIVIGAGIIGAACAWQLAKRGQRVALVDDGNAGATAAGMGHLVCMDDDPAELTLSAWSLARWRELTPRMPESCAWRGWRSAPTCRCSPSCRCSPRYGKLAKPDAQRF